MNTTARADSPKETDAADLLEELASADAAHAPEIADVIEKPLAERADG